MNSDIGATIAFGILALLLLFIGTRRGFFQFPDVEWTVPMRLLHILGAFAIYFIVSYFSTGIVVALFRKEIMANYMAYSNWLNFGVSFAIFILLAIYLKALPSKLRMGILCRPEPQHSFLDDVWTAFYAWILAFPLVLFLSQVLELIVLKVFQATQLPDQIAVKFLKSTFESPLYFGIAVISIIILAPLIEETLFRGFLQTYIRQHLGSKQAIVITSVCFSMFHYSAGQGLGNISIIPSLFVLSLFLGFLYEKRGCILSPMVLHASFNAVSVINLYLFGGFTTGI
jgi:membrane protease YdiL (CAAX protease family)